MKKLIPLLLFVFLFAACGTGTQIPAFEPTATPLPTNVPTETPTIVPSPTIEAIPSPTIAPTETPVSMRISPVDGMPQMFIPAGTFRMGGMDVRASANEKPAHDVTMDAFWMDQLEVTNAMYALCVGAGACQPPILNKSQRRLDYYNNIEFKDYPVVYVTWGQAHTYCEWAGRRLPTEAEWERSARGDDFRTFPWGEAKPDNDATLANFNFMVGDTTRVGTYAAGASPFGVLDMAGNVAEWVNDYFDPKAYETSPSANPQGPEVSYTYQRVVRGGSLGDAELNIRVAKRSSVAGPNPTNLLDPAGLIGEYSPRIGFRCAVSQ
jgi:formylglycine-generating enzyme required for sulfatase activity